MQAWQINDDARLNPFAENVERLNIQRTTEDVGAADIRQHLQAERRSGPSPLKLLAYPLRLGSLYVR